MKNRYFSLSMLFAFGVTVFCFCLVEVVSANPQTKSRRRAASTRATRPVVKNPPIAPASETEADEPKIISTADEGAAEEGQEQTNPRPKSSGGKKTASKDDKEEIEDTINTLSNQVERLNDKLSQMQENDKTLLDMERLTRAEQRTENLRAQLIDVESKLADLQSKLDQFEYSLRPENIERATQGYGTTRPEEARDMRRRQLENDRNRTQAQIRILETSKQRLEASLLTADAEVDRLRRRLELQEERDATKSEAGSSGNPKP